MPNTTKGYPYPAGSDSVDVPGDIQALADAVDASPGVTSYTSTQIAALTAGEKWAGRVVWNSTTGKLQVSNGSTFSDVDTSVALSSSTPQTLGTAAAGTSSDASRADHRHAMPSASDVGAASATHASTHADGGSDALTGLKATQVPTHVQNARTDSYTLILSDAGKLIEMGKATAQTLTIPTNASVAFPVGTKIDVMQTGAGETTIAGAGVTINSEGAKLKLNAQWAAATLIKRGTDTWVVIGSLKA